MTITCSSTQMVEKISEKPDKAKIITKAGSDGACRCSYEKDGADFKGVWSRDICQ